MYLQKVRKTTLSAFDEKRCYLNNIDSVRCVRLQGLSLDMLRSIFLNNPKFFIDIPRFSVSDGKTFNWIEKDIPYRCSHFIW